MAKNDIFEKNLVKFGNHVETKPLEPVLWNFAWINGRLCAFRWYKAEFLNIDTLSVIKISFVTVVFDERVGVPLFLPFFKLLDQLQTNGISKRFDAQRRDCAQIVDF